MTSQTPRHYTMTSQTPRHYTKRQPVSNKTLHVREMVRSETNAQFAMRKAKNELYTLEADLAAIERDLHRQVRKQRYKVCQDEADFCINYDKYNLTDFAPTVPKIKERPWAPKLS